MPAPARNLLALDVGDVRVGVAIASVIARLPRPLITLANDRAFLDSLRQIINSEDVKTLVVGLPRGLDGQETAQTQKTRQFALSLQQALDVKVELQDEAVTSVKAKQELLAKGDKFGRADVDALAAAYILEDYLLGAGKDGNG